MAEQEEEGLQVKIYAGSKALQDMMIKVTEATIAAAVDGGPLLGGTVSNPTVIEDGPQGYLRKRDASPGFYIMGGVPVEAEKGKKWLWFWNETSGALYDMGEYPKGAEVINEPGSSRELASSQDLATQGLRRADTLQVKIDQVQSTIPVITNKLDRNGYSGSADDLNNDLVNLSVKVSSLGTAPFGGVIVSAIDLSEQTAPVIYIATPGTYNTEPATVITETSVLTFDGKLWSHTPYQINLNTPTSIKDLIN